MRVTFWVSTGTRPVGGVKAIFEFANGLQRLGHTVNLVHFQFAGHSVDAAADIEWFDIHPGVRQLFIREGDGQSLPDADFIFPYHAVFPRAVGLPLNLVQGYRMMPPEIERALYVAPCPKICIAKWLVGIGHELGAPDEQLVYVPNGIDHSTFRLVHPLEGRAPVVAMLYHTHAMKGTPFGLEALVLAKGAGPEMTVLLFGTRDAPSGLPPWMHAVKSPPLETLVSEIYNRSRVFVCPSIVEGFGLPSIEAMAGGCARDDRQRGFRRLCHPGRIGVGVRAEERRAVGRPHRGPPHRRRTATPPGTPRTRGRPRIRLGSEQRAARRIPRGIPRRARSLRAVRQFVTCSGSSRRAGAGTDSGTIAPNGSMIERTAACSSMTDFSA